MAELTDEEKKVRKHFRIYRHDYRRLCRTTEKLQNSLAVLLNQDKPLFEDSGIQVIRNKVYFDIKILTRENINKLKNAGINIKKVDYNQKYYIYDFQTEYDKFLEENNEL